MNDDIFYNEMDVKHHQQHKAYTLMQQWLKQTPVEDLHAFRKEAEMMFRKMGITFAVYGEKEAEERIIPFDIIPRIITQAEWQKIEKGLIQRVKVLNMFLSDIYSEARAIKEKIIPEELIYLNPAFKIEMIGRSMPHNIWVPIAGIDIIRTDKESFYVLEDNVRTPSGVSYMLENREIMQRLLPDIMEKLSIAPIENYPDLLLSTLSSLSPSSDKKHDATCVLLTPGIYNSAYYEHSFLANKLGIELVEGIDLFVDNNYVFMRTTQGPQKVDVIYRRIDDDFMDPLAFKEDSMLGIPGLLSAYRAGNVYLANALGAGIADDKAVYTYIPELTKFYLNEEPILKNVPTYQCSKKEDLIYVLKNLETLVVKEVDSSGGYGMLIGSKASIDELQNFEKKIKEKPGKFIAQPILNLSTSPSLGRDMVVNRHIDLRPFVLTGAQGTKVVPGGLTRVAMKEGSLIVNSSQGGGVKDSWVTEL